MRNRVVVALLCGALATSGLTRAETPSARGREAAECYARAMKLLDQRDFAEAVNQLERAYALSPRPVVLYNIGIADAELGRTGAAVDALERYLASPSEVTPALRERAEQKLREQLARLGTVVVQSNVSGSLRIDGTSAGSPPLARRLEPGTHWITFEQPDRAARRFEVKLSPGETVRLMVESTPAPRGNAAVTHAGAKTAQSMLEATGDAAEPTPAREERPARWRASTKIALGVTVALAASAGGLVLWNQGRWNEWQASRDVLLGSQPTSTEGQLAWDAQRQQMNQRLSSIQTVDRLALGLGLSVLVSGAVTTYLVLSERGPTATVAPTAGGMGAAMAFTF